MGVLDLQADMEQAILATKEMKDEDVAATAL
jgi:hypothetical protein